MWAAPNRSAEDRVLLCMHGGGFISGSIYSHRKMFGHLAKATGARALIFDYHLTPEHAHPSRSTTRPLSISGCSTRESAPTASPSPAIPVVDCRSCGPHA
jgi:alpha/beta hydrolase family protein